MGNRTIVAVSQLYDKLKQFLEMVRFYNVKLNQDKGIFSIKKLALLFSGVKLNPSKTVKKLLIHFNLKLKTLTGMFSCYLFAEIQEISKKDEIIDEKQESWCSKLTQMSFNMFQILKAGSW